MRQGEVMQLEIPSSPEYVAIVRHAIEGIARRMQFSANEIEDLKLAVGEACTNAVKYGLPNDGSPNVEIICTVLPEGLSVEIRNSVLGTDSLVVPTKPDLTREGGLGLYMMRELMDDVSLSWDKGVAIVRMLKRVHATAV